MYVLFLCYLTMAFSSFSREADKMSISPSRIHPFQCCRGLIGQGEQLQFSVLIFLTIQLKQEQIVLERTARLNLDHCRGDVGDGWSSARGQIFRMINCKRPDPPDNNNNNNWGNAQEVLADLKIIQIAPSGLFWSSLVSSWPLSLSWSWTWTLSQSWEFLALALHVAPITFIVVIVIVVAVNT